MMDTLDAEYFAMGRPMKREETEGRAYQTLKNERLAPVRLSEDVRSHMRWMCQFVTFVALQEYAVSFDGYGNGYDGILREVAAMMTLERGLR